LSSDLLKNLLAELLIDDLGVYVFEGVGTTPAIACLHKGEATTPRLVQGLECIVFRIPSRSSRGHEFDVTLKWWADGKNNYAEVCDRIQENLALTSFVNLSVREQPDLLAMVALKITYPICFDDDD
jgi:hypothetical protein